MPMNGLMKNMFSHLFKALAIGGSVTAFAAVPLGTPSVDDIEYPDDEPHTELEVELGKKLYFDTRLSLNKRQSCATCHNPDLGFGDGLAKGIGTMGEAIPRNTPHIYNLAWNSIFFWDGRSGTLEEQALGPIEAPGEMNLSLDEAVSRLKSVPYYAKTFDKVYGDGVTSENIGRAIAAFERTVITDNSPFDKYLKGDKAAMSPAAVRGLALFEGKANCTKCHDGVNFTDQSFHNIGVKGEDMGREKIAGDESLAKAFKTPGLRNVAFTAPYMHDGSEPSLEAVVRFYNRGGDVKEGISELIVPLNLNDEEVMDLVAFMGALSDPVEIERPDLP